MITFSKKVDRVEEYYFSQKLKEVKALISAGKPIINMGIGSPDRPPHQKVIDALHQTSSQQSTHGYQNYQGIPELRQAFLDFYKNKYGVDFFDLDEVLPLMGSKEGVLHISQAFLDEGDKVLIPNPGYPTYTSVLKMLNIESVYYDLKEEKNWYPDLEDLGKRDLSKVKLMWVNYPHMPTGARAEKGVFKRLVEFASYHQILLVHDNPYSLILEDQPKSIFEVPGAKDVALELNSLSKTANMAGWRVGAVIGKKEFIQAIFKIKSNVDSGMFLGIQHAAIEALHLGVEWTEQLNQVYTARRKLMWELADRLQLKYKKDSAGMFLWAKLPEGQISKDFVDRLLKEKNIFIAPGDIFGSNGEGWVRFSLCVSEEKIKEAIHRC